MLAIVYDLEMTVTRKKGQISEIIELGAVKVGTQDGHPVILDQFQSFVKPTLSQKITMDTTSFTGIRQEDVSQADSLQDVLDRFVAWIDTDDYALCSWGQDDKTQFIKECRQKKSGNQQIGLKAALEQLQIEFVGNHHRAIDDAYNTALVYMHYADQIELEHNQTSDHAEYKSALIYQATDDSDDSAASPFSSLAMLFNPSEK